MISTTRDATIVNKEERQENMDIKPYAVLQYNLWKAYMTDQGLLLLSSQEHCKMVEKIDIVSAKMCNLQCTFCVHDTKYKTSKRTFCMR
jgi:sulfatase maturation enzyme AslB (radical SAM superfamily)